MTTTRVGHTATLLPNGKVLVAGGSYLSVLASAELYDPVAGTWSATGSMTTPREEHTATLLPSGKVLVAGGFSGLSSVLASAELYDPVAGTWSATGNMATTRARHTATLLLNGKVLVAEGFSSTSLLASAELYDPVAGTWSATDNMITPRDRHTATLLPSGKVLVAGGLNIALISSDQASAELYDPVAGTWSATGNMTTQRYSHTATLLPSGKVLVAGGGNSTFYYLASAELYDPVAGTWSATGSMATPRVSPTATLLSSGKVLVAGGLSSNPSVLASAELYDPVAGTWSATGSMATPRVSHTATQLSSGKVLVAGGFHGTIVASAELYDPGNTIDKTPPVVSCTASPRTLWPPNGKFVPVQITVSVTDPDGSGPNGYTLVAITSNEGKIANEQQGFVIGTSSTSGKLRAARNDDREVGRVYTLTYQGSDVAGNTATCAVKVRVPLDHGH